jgi:eukaryotic-like serine/threonine-protein kinase
VLYEMATNTLPFRGETTGAIFDSILHAEPVPVIRLNPDVPSKFEDVIAKCLEKDPETRYQSAAELKADLKRLQRDSDSQRTVIATPPPKPSAKPKTWVLVAAGVLVVLLAVLAIGYFNPIGHSRSQTTSATKSVETIAVLPFRDLSGSGSDSWAIGMTDAVISRLTSLKNLAVRPTTSVMKYAKETPEPTEAAKALGVSSILEGTYQRSADVIRVTVQLIDGSTGTTKWSQRYDLRSADILTFEDEIASKVVDGLQIQISPTEQKSIEQVSTKNVEAYNDYLQARFEWNEYMMSSRLENLQNGERLLLHAVSLDPNFAHAYALLANFYDFQAANFSTGASDNLKRAEENANRALKLNPDLPEGMYPLGGAYVEAGSPEKGIPLLRRAVALEPNNGDALQMLSYSSYYIGFNQRAGEGYHRISELNPLTLQPHWMYARMLLYQGRGDEAEREMREVVGRSPDQYKALGYFGMMLYYNGKLDEAQGYLDRAVQLSPPGEETALIAAGMLYAARKQRDKIAPQLLQYRPDQQIDADAAEWLGGIHALLGDRDQAIAWLKRSVELGLMNYPWYQHDKNYDSLRSDPEFQKIMAGVREKYEAYQKQFGE